PPARARRRSRPGASALGAARILDVGGRLWSRALMPSLVAVLYVPDRHAGAGDGALSKLRRLERYKRNPRPAEYMRELARVTLGSRCEIVEAAPGRDPSARLPADRLAAA